MTKFIERLKILMDERDLRATDLVKDIGIPKQTISGYLTNQRSPNAVNIIKLADYFGVNAGWLMGFIDERNLSNSNINDKYYQLDERNKELVNNFIEMISSKN